MFKRLTWLVAILAAFGFLAFSASRPSYANVVRGYTGTGLDCKQYDDVGPSVPPRPGMSVDKWHVLTEPAVDRFVMSELNFSYNASGWGLWEYWSMECLGGLWIPQDDTYTFIGYADDAVRVWVDGTLIVNDWSISYATAKTGSIYLKQGIHNIRVVYVQGPATDSILRLTWRSSSFGEEIIQATGITPEPPQVDLTFACDQWGNNGWCLQGGRLQVHAQDPLGGQVTVSGDVTCTGTPECTASVPLTNDGSGTAQVTASSPWGSASDSATWAVDATTPTANPSVSGTVGANGWYVSQATVSANASDATSGVASVEYQVDGGAWQNGASVTLSDGVHTVQFRVTDNAGNVTTTPVQAVKVDATAPVLNPSLSSPDGQNGWFVTAPVQVDASANDATSGLASLQCHVDGGDWQAPPVSVTGDGTHTVDCRATDNAGNVGTWSETVKVDTTIPALTSSVPSPDGQNGWFVTAPVQVDANANDATSGLASLQCRVDGGDWQAPPVSVTGDGIHTVECQAQDNAGNTATRSNAVKVDTTPPQSAFRTPTEGATVWGVVALQGESDDPASGPASVEVSTDGGATWQPASLTSDTQWAATWDTRPLPDGTYTLMARAVDNAGNEEHTAIVHVTVANTPPEVAIKPKEWVFWQTAYVRIEPNPYIPIGRVRVTITDTYKPGRVRVWEYQTEFQDTTTIPIQWNSRWYAEDGPYAFAGGYPVKVEVWDVYGRKAMDTGIVYVPLQPTATSTPTATPTATPTPTPTPVLFQAPFSTATVKPVATTTPTPTPTSTPEPTPIATKQRDKGSLAKPVPIGVVGGVMALLAWALVADPRPKPTHGLANTIRQITRYLERKEEHDG